MKKSLIIVVFTLLFLVACGDDKKEETNEKEQQNQEEKQKNEENSNDNHSQKDDNQNERTDNSSEIDDKNEENEDSDKENNVAAECTPESMKTLGGYGCSRRTDESEYRNFTVECGCSAFKIEKVTTEDQVSGFSGKCLDENEESIETECSVSFFGYNKDLFKDSLVGKEISIISEDVSEGLMQVLKHKNGILIAVSNGNIWPSKLVSDIAAEQKVLPTCENVCEILEEPYFDYVYYPPVEFKIGENNPVLVGNGEAVVADGYEYYVSKSKILSPDDPDHLFFNEELGMEFNFIILNRDALQ